MAIFSGEVTIKVRFKDIQVVVGYGMTSAIIKHRCVEQAYAKSPSVPLILIIAIKNYLLCYPVPILCPFKNN